MVVMLDVLGHDFSVMSKWHEITIRDAEPDEADSIRQCAVLAYAHYIQRIGRPPAPMVADFEAQIAYGIVHVAVNEDGHVLGFIVFHPDGDFMMLGNV